MKVPIEDMNEERPGAGTGADGQAESDELVGDVVGDATELDEEAMVAAARAAGEAAAEADLSAEAARAAAKEASAAAEDAEAAADAAQVAADAAGDSDAGERASEDGGSWTAADDEQVAADAALRGELEAAKAEAAEAGARLARLQADWENYRRRTAAERSAERERAAERLVTALLPVLDDMERASAHAAGTDEAAEEDSAFAQFVAGVDAVHDKMVGVLAREGVEVIDPAGEPFDPLEHQAVGRVEDSELPADTVAQVYQRGYRMGGKVIRSAMVTVTYGGPARPSEA